MGPSVDMRRFVTTINAHLLQEFQQKTAQTATAMGCVTALVSVTVMKGSVLPSVTSQATGEVYIVVPSKSKMITTC